MSLHEIKKQQLLQEPFDADALKLARAIYNTYLENNEDLFMEIKITAVLNLFKLHSSQKALKYLRFLFEELNEPLCVKDFKYCAKTYAMRFVIFCSYKIKEETIEIELSEEFLHVEDVYMSDPFLKG